MSLNSGARQIGLIAFVSVGAFRQNGGNDTKHLVELSYAYSDTGGWVNV